MNAMERTIFAAPAEVTTACSYEYEGCTMPASAVPEGVIISHGICRPCVVKLRAGEPIPAR